MPGKLVAKSYDDETLLGTSSLTTISKPLAIKLITYRKMMTEDLDELGNVVPYADDLNLQVKINGKERIAALSNENPEDMSSFQQDHKKVFHGKALAIIRSGGKPNLLSVAVSAMGIKPDRTSITIQ